MLETTYAMARGDYLLRLQDAKEQTYALYESARVNLCRIKREQKNANNKVAPRDETLLKATKLRVSLFQIYMKAVRDLNRFVKNGNSPAEAKCE
jgi:hypothetical protein